MELRGKSAIITGSSGRLGSAIATSLATAGCNCICHYNHNRQKAETLAERLQSFGVKAMAIEADLTKPERIDLLFERAAELGTPQILINSAAVFSRGALNDVTFEEARRVLDINLTAAILTSRAFAKTISAEFPNTKLAPAQAGVGKIINISGIAGIRPWAKYILYCSSKAGLIGATKALAKELAPAICVNSIAPGMVTWPDNFSEKQKQRQIKLIPVGRIAETKDVTDAIIFLLKNDYITGQVLGVDGGRCI
jgi:NAD(P)-dependent dehydrogenase (short-subunit alcohol dehydrogenase family)